VTAHSYAFGVPDWLCAANVLLSIVIFLAGFALDLALIYVAQIIGDCFS
jgi:hypothetical protein